jgi:hypothetical protein
VEEQDTALGEHQRPEPGNGRGEFSGFVRKGPVWSDSRGTFIACRPLHLPATPLGVVGAAPASRSDAPKAAVDLGPRLGAWEWLRVA